MLSLFSHAAFTIVSHFSFPHTHPWGKPCYSPNTCPPLQGKMWQGHRWDSGNCWLRVSMAQHRRVCARHAAFRLPGLDVGLYCLSCLLSKTSFPHMEYYSAIKKEWNWVICRDVDGPREYHREWSKSEREKQILYINAYMWDLEKWYRWTVLQGRNWETDVENKCMDTKGEKGEEGGIRRLGLTHIHYWYYV